MNSKSSLHFKTAFQCVIVCLAVAGIVGCNKNHPPDVIVQGHHLSESQASSLALAALPKSSQAGAFKADYKDGNWEISTIPMTIKDGKPVPIITNRLEVVAKVRDSDGKVEIVNSP